MKHIQVNCKIGYMELIKAGILVLNLKMDLHPRTRWILPLLNEKKERVNPNQTEKNSKQTKNKTKKTIEGFFKK